MDRDLWKRAADVFLELADLSGAERTRRLEEACRDRPGLRALVRRLLEADADENTVLDQSPEALATLLEPADDDLPEAFGPYRVLGELGRGGMGTVYLAERADGRFDRAVAIKVVRGGFDDPRNVTRFESEVRILAGLEHPGIARLYDADTEGASPYLVMEYVEGRRIDRYCDEEALGLRARVELFQQVCGAVQFAHQNLVIHRDLKPSNVLVTPAGRVKLLDFGIAKLMDEGAGAEETVTRRALTPGYASPEQLRGQPLTTGSDIYSLGIILYELLVGRRPFETAPGDLVALAERSGREPESPSTAAGQPFTVPTSSGEATTVTPDDVAAARGLSPERLRRELKGDLDHIVLKALRPDPAARYASVEALAEDLRRHLTGRPVSARADSVGYRLRKYVQRHRGGIMAAGLAALMLIAFSAFYTVRVTRERNLARSEAEKARATTEFLQRLLGDAYPSVALGDTFSMSDLLSRAVLRVDSLDAQPEIQAELLRTLGDVYREQGRFEEALPLLERSLALHREGGEATRRSVVQTLDALGQLHYENRSYDEAFRAFTESLELSERLVEPDDSMVLFSLNNLAATATELGDHPAALSAYETILDRHGRLFPDTSQLIYVTRNNLGHLLHAMDDFAGAEAQHREALRLRRLALPPEHPSIALGINNLAETLEELGRLEEAEALHREALAMFERIFGAEHHRVSLSAFNLAGILRGMGRFDEAEQYYRRALSIDRTAYGERHTSTGVDLRSLGLMLVEKGDCDGGIEALTEADAIFAFNQVPLTHRRRLTTRAALGDCLTRLGRYPEAEALLLASAEAVRSAAAEADSAGARQTVDALAGLYEAWGRPATADSLWRSEEERPR